jgi:TPR repeat protein
MEGSIKKTKLKSYFELALTARKNEQYDKFVSYLQKGSKLGNQDCSYLLSKCHSSCYYGFKDPLNYMENAFSLLKNYDNHGKSMAQMAYMLYNGLGCKGDRAKCEEIVQKIFALEKNHYAKGYCHYHGLISTYNHEIGFKELLIAAEEGDDEAQHLVALYFLRGDNRDYIKGHQWLLKSAEQGNPDSFIDLAIYLNKGTKLPKNYEKSIYWYSKYSKIAHYHPLANVLRISEPKARTYDLNLHLAKCYLTGEKVEEKNLYLSWYFFKKTSEPTLELQEYEKTIFSGFANCRKMTLTLLCIAKYFAASLGIPGDILKMLARYVWKTKLDKEWENK